MLPSTETHAKTPPKPGRRKSPEYAHPTGPGYASVVRRVLGNSGPAVVLHRSQIRTLVGPRARVPEHVGPDPSKLPLLAGQTHEIAALAGAASA